MTRRDFAKTAAGMAFTSNLFTGQTKGQNNNIQIAGIGMGQQGGNLLKGFLKFANRGVRVVAVCDVFQPMLDRAVQICRQAGQTARPYHDFRDLLAQKDIDAVVIATPDHWHPYMTVEACRQNKDVYVEKPTSVDITGGQKMLQAARKYNRVVQVGTQQRSDKIFQDGKTIVEAGRLGRITMVRTLINGGELFSKIGHTPETDPPPGLDWDLWLGPAADPKECPFSVNRFGMRLNPDGTPTLNKDGNPVMWSTFRITDCGKDNWEFAGGMATDWGVHLLDIPRWYLNVAGPIRVVALGGKYVFNDDRVTPDTFKILYEINDPKKSVWELEHRSAGVSPSFNRALDNRGRESGIIFFGSDATLGINRAGYEVRPDPDKEDKVLKEPLTVNGENIPFSQDQKTMSDSPHIQNFLDCIRTRQRPIADIEDGHRSTVMCLLGNAALRTRLSIDWNPTTETTPQKEAWSILFRQPRAGWEIVV